MPRFLRFCSVLAHLILMPWVAAVLQPCVGAAPCPTYVKSIPLDLIVLTQVIDRTVLADAAVVSISQVRSPVERLVSAFVFEGKPHSLPCVRSSQVSFQVCVTCNHFLIRHCLSGGVLSIIVVQQTSTTRCVSSLTLLARNRVISRRNEEANKQGAADYNP